MVIFHITKMIDWTTDTKRDVMLDAISICVDGTAGVADDAGLHGFSREASGSHRLLIRLTQLVDLKYHRTKGKNIVALSDTILLVNVLLLLL